MFSRCILKYNTNGVFKLCRLPLQFRSSYHLKSFKSNDTKLSNSLSRSKRILKEYLMNNKFKYFVTFTFNNNYNSYDLDFIRKIITQKIRDLRKLHNFTFLYVFVPERHKKGDWHLHGFLNSAFDIDLYLNEHKYLSLKSFDNYGQITIEVIRNQERATNYILKYITKELVQINKSKHVYFCSHGLKKARKLRDGVYTDLGINFDFENDYCSILDFEKNRLEEINSLLDKKFYNYYDNVTN